jgi:glycosyltransferase involved in cell wall biosynthesis
VREESPGNDERREVAELLREAFLTSLRPDVIHVCSLFEGYADDAVTSIGRFDRRTPISITLHASDDPPNTGSTALQAFRRRKQEYAKQASVTLTPETTAEEAIAAWEALPRPGRPTTAAPAERKARLAFVSPLPPERTGIADYSAELLPALAAHYDIELVVAQDRVADSWANHNGKVRDAAWLRANAEEIDRVVYQIGNSPFHWHMLGLLEHVPGTVVLHDFFLSHLLSWMEDHVRPCEWWSALYDSHGYGAVRDRHRDAEEAKLSYPANWPVLQKAQGVICHSASTRKLAQDWYGERVADSWAVVPHVRAAAEAWDRHWVRKQLGLRDDDFVVCSFGFLGPTKLNHRLLDCWLRSPLADERNCQLIFVGENPVGDYGASLLKAIRASGRGSRIRITGFASPEEFRSYLRVADLAVQLRTRSRGESSGTVLDCMSHAVPVVVNANGSFAELDRESVWMLSDEFDDAELGSALERLWRSPELRKQLGERGRVVIDDMHSPTRCAGLYAEAIERFAASAAFRTPDLVRAIADVGRLWPDDGELRRLAAVIDRNHALPRPAKRLYLDLTATSRNDLRTGIERVARALTLALLDAPPVGYRVEPVYLSDAGGSWHYRYARRYTLGLLGCSADILADDPVEPECGDILLGLDLSSDLLVQAESAGLFTSWRNRGVLVYATVFDLLPVMHPKVFPPGADEVHARWLEAIAGFDGAVCISNAVAHDLREWQSRAGNGVKDRRPFSIDWFSLGADVLSSAPTLGLPSDATQTLEKIKSRPSFLMVGTIEPRKGYSQVLEAFDALWKDGVDANLVIIGREGWDHLPAAMRRDIPETVKRLRFHSELNNRLFWLEGISDEYLEMVYSASACLIAASCGEGFGLPLIEAAQHELPIICRDIPVFREVAGEHAFYFEANRPDELAQAVRSWFRLYSMGKHPGSEDMQWLTWKDSAASLLERITGRAAG